MAFDGTIQEFTLAMHGPARRTPCIEVQQADTASRKVLFHLKTFGGGDYAMPYDAAAVVCVAKADGKRVLNDCEIVDQSTVLVTFSTQAVACAGEQRAQLYICNSEGDIKSQGFYINVPKAVYSDDAVESADEYGVLRRLVVENQGIQDAEAARANAEAERAANEAARQETAGVMETVAQTCMAVTEDARAFSREKSDAIIQTASGTAIAVHDSSDDPVRGLRVFGRTGQRTTTGAQLLRGTDTLWSDGVKTSSSQETGIWREASLTAGTITVGKQGNNTLVRIERAEGASGVIDMGQNKVPIETGKTYTISAVAKGIGNIRFRYGIGEYKVMQKPLANAFEKLSYTFTAEEQYVVDGKANIYFGVSHSGADGSQPWVEFYDMMLCEGDSTPDYEPYTGGIPSPNPDYPQELVSVGDGGEINVSITDGTEEGVQSLTLQTPNGLPGIPATNASIANYIDEDGQMWVCDEVDLERGVYVQRVKDATYDGSADELWRQSMAMENAFVVSAPDIIPAIKYYCGQYIGVASVSEAADKTFWCDGNNNILVYNTDCGSLDDFIDMLQEQPIRILSLLNTPTETPLTATELAAYQSLRTNYQVTTVMNDAGAHMEVSYNADPRNYISQNYIPKSSYEALESRVAALEQNAIS